MTRAEFNNALEEALQKAARVRAYTGGGCEIALIVTRDVYRFLSEHAGVTFDVRNTDHGIYRGYRGMEVNDIIVVGDENRLFQLESREPICFRDMGLTVSFGNGTRATANVTVTNTAVDAINETNAAETVTAAAVNAARPVEMNYRDGQLFVDGIPIDLPLVDLAMEDLVGVTTPVTTPQLEWNATGRATVDWFGAVPVAATEPTRPVRAQRAARPRAPRAEEPLNPGDTKMLDEFLGSFAIKETLQHA